MKVVVFSVLILTGVFGQRLSAQEYRDDTLSRTGREMKGLDYGVNEIHGKLPSVSADMYAQLSGTVYVNLLIGMDGKAIRCEIVQSAGDIFDEAAIDAVMSVSFRPVSRKPRKQRLAVPVVFRQKKGYPEMDDREQAIFNYSILIPGDSLRRAERYYQRGKLHFQNADYWNAENDLQTARQLDPEADRPDYRAFFLSRTDTGIADPADACSWLELGDRFFSNYLYAESIEKYRRAIQIRPAYATGYRRTARSLSRLGFADSAIAEYRKVLSFKQDDTLSWVNTGWIFYEKEEFDSSIAYSKRAIELDPQNPTARYNLALAYLRRDESDTAKNLYIEAREINRRNGQAASPEAIGDLKKLVNKDIMRSEARDILKEVFNITY